MRTMTVRTTLGLALGAMSVAVAMAAPASAATAGWRVDYHPQPAGLSLHGVYTASAHEAWVAGTHQGRGHISTGVSDSTAVIEQWNGARWTRTAGLPAVAEPVAALNAIGGTGPDDVWAVGDTVTESGATAGLAEHFDGSTWAVVPSASVAGATLGTVSADSPSDAWAGGFTAAGPVAVHWNGTAWQVTTLPVPADATAVTSVYAVSPADAWVVGIGHIPGYSGGGFSFLDHWNGSKWKLVSTTATGIILTAVSGTGAGDIWAMGSSADPAGPMIEHFDGAAWTQVTDPAANGQVLAAFDALTPQDAWAMSGDGMLVERWNGTAWQRVNTAPYLPAGFALASMSGVTGGPLFAVGGTGILEQPHA